MSVVNTDAALFGLFHFSLETAEHLKRKAVRNAMRQRNIKSNKYVRATRCSRASFEYYAMTV